MADSPLSEKSRPPPRFFCERPAVVAERRRREEEALIPRQREEARPNPQAREIVTLSNSHPSEVFIVSGSLFIICGLVAPYSAVFTPTVFLVGICTLLGVLIRYIYDKCCDNDNLPSPRPNGRP